MDRILLRRVNEDEEQPGIIPDEQGGFSEGHSTQNKVMIMVEDMITIMENMRIMCKTYSNVEKTLDKIWQKGLIAKIA